MIITVIVFIFEDVTLYLLVIVWVVVVEFVTVVVNGSVYI